MSHLALPHLRKVPVPSFPLCWGGTFCLWVTGAEFSVYTPRAFLQVSIYLKTVTTETRTDVQNPWLSKVMLVLLAGSCLEVGTCPFVVF